MKKREVITIPNPKLQEVTEKVTSFESEIKKQIKIMTQTLRKEGGIGLAANQIGYQNQVIIAEFQDEVVKKQIPLSVFINPKIVEYSQEKECLKEGCLSVPKIELDLTRPTKIKLKFQDDKGRKLKLAPRGLLARILQHEIDHLNGIIFTEHIKEELFKQYPKLKNLKILFFGTGEFAKIILYGLFSIGFDVTIVTEKSKPAGRDKKSKLTAVAEVAEKFGKKYQEISDFGLHASRSGRISDFDLLVCSDFGKTIPQTILNKARIVPINIHPSLLPKYRGPSPIQTAILAGEKKTGVTMIKMTDKIDAGPILAQAETEILENDDYLTLRDRLATFGLKLLIKTLPDISQDNLKEILQDNEAATLTRKFTKADGEIDWSKPAEEIYAHIRAFYPWPGSYTFVNNKRLIIHKARLEKNSKLILDIVQSEGKKPMKFSEFLRGYKGQKPKWFEKISQTLPTN